MNIFYLDKDPKICAEMHVDKHCVKMILEYAQLLSTAHRVLDGSQLSRQSKTGRLQKYWKLEDHRDSVLYSATHINHPSAVWVRQSLENYQWLYTLFVELCYEYKFRYERDHKTSLLMDVLQFPPDNISKDILFTEPTPAMPEHYKVNGDSVTSYKNYYLGDKTRMFAWKKRETPYWIY
jgi:hypothetical protein